MFGSVFRMEAKPGEKASAIDALMDDTRKPKGMKAAYIFETGGEEFWGVAVFEDEATYQANANDPEQDKEYQRLRQHLVADPEWHDGAIRAWPGNK